MRFILLTLGGVLCAATLAAQATVQQGGTTKIDPKAQVDSNVSVETRDGSTIVGRLEKLDADSVVVVGSGGRIAFARSLIREIRSAGEAHQRLDGSTEYWFPNLNSTRLLFAPTGRMLPEGEGYVADHWVILGSFAVGVTDRVTVGGGSFLIPNSEAWFITPKLGLVSSEKVNVAVGALFGGLGDETGGVAFLTSTFGKPDGSVTIALGNGFSGAKAAHQQVIMVGGEKRVSRRVSLISENYGATGSSEVGLSYGLRFMGERMSIDLAFLNGAEHMLFPGIPWVDFVIKW